MTCEGFYNQAEMTLECGITIMNHTTTNENEFDRFLMRANRLYFHLYFFIKMTEVLQVLRVTSSLYILPHVEK